VFWLGPEVNDVWPEIPAPSPFSASWLGPQREQHRGPKLGPGPFPQCLTHDCFRFAGNLRGPRGPPLCVSDSFYYALDFGPATFRPRYPPPGDDPRLKPPFSTTPGACQGNPTGLRGLLWPRLDRQFNISQCYATWQNPGQSASTSEPPFLNAKTVQYP